MNIYKTGIFILENKLLYNRIVTPWEYGNLQKVSLALLTVRKVSQTLCKGNSMQKWVALSFNM